MQEAKQGILFIAVITTAAAGLLHLADPPSRPVTADAALAAAAPASKPQTICPVMGGMIDKNLYVDVKGKRLYICCMACEDAIKVEPDRYLEKIRKRGETVEDTPQRKGN